MMAGIVAIAWSGFENQRGLIQVSLLGRGSLDRNFDR